MDWQKVTQLGPTVNKFLNRITNPKLGPLTYEEGRQFYQILGKMSADETMKMAPPIRAQLTQLVVGLKQDLGTAADTVGRAADYYQGMGDYAKASKYQQFLDDASDFAKKAAITGGLGAIGAGGVAKLVNYFNQEITNSEGLALHAAACAQKDTRCDSIEACKHLSRTRYSRSRDSLAFLQSFRSF